MLTSQKAKYLKYRASTYADSYDYHESSAAISICTGSFHVPEFIYHPKQTCTSYWEVSCILGHTPLSILAQARAEFVGLGRLLELRMCL